MAILALNFRHRSWLNLLSGLALSWVACTTLTACSNTNSAPIENAWNDIGSTQTRHVVQAGETIYTIAWRFGVNYKELASWNNLSPPYALKIGQMLRLTPPVGAAPGSTILSEPAASKVAPAPQFTPASTVKRKAPSKTSEAPAKSTLASTTNEPSSLSEVSAGATPSGTGNWPWPLQGKVLQNYGQAGNKGIDIAAPIGSQVHAVQEGTVVYAGNNLRGYGQLVIIKQKDDMMTAYAHNSKLLVKPDSHVNAGQVIALSGDSEATQPMLHFEVRMAGKPVDPLQYLKSAK